ncbi:G-type lectin S-receptor-like serine/threonine-protein kinase At4g27290 isoform X1 [Salvia miltiorrhiza]|uniref:G-type lectin S-receptor-like serine/threonine-protein kinase At4g27290 isoform X1 n=1 Tax=Salvia miltiorrhiza TaxID=226208 RepID=UPI0025AD371B|nr:G-type lectin S-receptor-like serine/threonine-protein kinase At4g27290 isoform X1 [Salvia miltiorrhiza]
MNMICSSRFSLCLFLFTTSFFYAHTIDTIDTSQIVSDARDDTLISSSGTFALGFYSPENSNNRYVGIWYNKIKDKTVVWVANRDDPLTDRSGTLRVIEPGRLLLLNAKNATIWAANVSSSSVHTPIARLLDSGNLILTDANDDKNFIWQSFDYPTDTHLPGMKLGRNFVSGHEVYISSAKSNDDPATGGFTYHCDPTGYPQNVIKAGASFRYKSGPWNGVRFSGSHNLMKNTLFTFGVVMNKNEVYYYYQLLNDSVYTRLTLSENGAGQRWRWSTQTQNWMLYLTFPIDNCDIYKVCGAHGVCSAATSPDCSCLNKFKPSNPQGWDGGDFSDGCIRRTPLNCEDGDVFLKYSGIKLPDSVGSWYNASMNLEECKVACAINCSCTAYASLNISNGESGCLLWFGDLVNMRQQITPGLDIHIRMAKSELGSGSRKREMLTVMLSVGIGILLLGLSMLLYYRKRKKLKHQQQETDKLRKSDETHEELELPMFELSTMSKATDGFSLNNKLGEGGFGPVFKGLLEGQEIAVKRLSTTSRQGAHEFKNEVICIAKLQHRNLVKLLGCCIQGEERMLVYEYMTNKSLDIILFDQVKKTILDWPRRFNIINGIARGLMYLHQDSRLRVIHRDLKASNILLDSDMIPKISDFGLARTFGGNETGADTSRVVGTYGYMSPEYAVDGMFSVKSDVFSFGVLVLEIISGKRNRGFTLEDHRHNLLGHAWMLYKEEKSLELVDSCVEYSSYLSQVARSIHVGLLCVQEEREERPNMSSVVLMLNNDGVLPEAKHPGFFTARDIIRTETSDNSNTASSTNTMTVSLLEAR